MTDTNLPKDEKKLHVKPTKDELDAKIKASLETLDKEDVQEDPGTPPKEPDTKTPDEKQEEEVEETKEEKPQDYKKKFTESSREAQILYSKSKKMSDSIMKAGEIEEPTEEELQAKYEDWDVMTDFEKKMAKESLHSQRKIEAITNTAKEFKELDAWNGKVDEFLSDAETLVDHPGLDGKEEDFKIFANKPTKIGVDFETLVSAFLYENDSKPKNRGQMFETGSAQRAEKVTPKDDRITTEESQRLRITNYKKYLEFVRSGKIKDPD